MVADIDLNELGPEVGLACFEELLAQNDITIADTDYIPVEEADVLGLVSFRDQREKVELGAETPFTRNDGWVACDLDDREASSRCDTF